MTVEMKARLKTIRSKKQLDLLRELNRKKTQPTNYTEFKSKNMPRNY